MFKQFVTEKSVREGQVIKNRRGDVYTVLAVVGKVAILGDKKGYYTKIRTVKALVENKYFRELTTTGEAEIVDVGGCFETVEKEVIGVKGVT